MSNNNEDRRGEPFRGFRGPHYTQVPDALFDELLPRLSGTELKVLLYIIRRTFGFKRDADTISLSQMVSGIVKRDGTRLDHGAGVSKKSLLLALRSLEQQRFIFTERRRSAERGDEATLYRLNVVDFATPDPRGVETLPGGGAKLHQGGGVVPSPGGEARNSPTQETGEQETGEQETEFEISKFRRGTPSHEQGVDESPRAAALASAPEPIEGRDSDPEPIAAVLQRRTRPRRSSPREEALDEDYQRIQDAIADRAREFNDTAPLKSSVTRAHRLFKRSGLPISAFIDHVYKARALTQESSARITKKATDPEYRVKRTTKMAYFFAVLEDHLGLSAPAPSTKRPSSAQPKADPSSPSRADPEDKYRGVIQR